MILKMWVKVSENGWVKVGEKLPPRWSIDPEKSRHPFICARVGGFAPILRPSLQRCTSVAKTSERELAANSGGTASLQDLKLDAAVTSDQVMEQG